MNIISFIEILKPILLIFLAVSSNYLANILPCSFQYYLYNSMYARHICLFFLIYLTIDFTKYLHININILHPFEILINTIIIYISYILFSKQNIQFFTILLFLLIIYYININIVEYNNNNNNYITEKNITIYKNIDKYFPYLISIILIIGFIKYFIKQYKDHYKNFNILKFIFGIKTCDNYKDFHKIDLDGNKLINKKEFDYYFKNM
tara:strand:- start:3131 stop:3751 length:621 start_codon:yes stop_codon:yes gene_type:complete